jgi:hypothetical protein
MKTTRSLSFYDLLVFFVLYIGILCFGNANILRYPSCKSEHPKDQNGYQHTLIFSVYWYCTSQLGLPFSDKKIFPRNTKQDGTDGSSVGIPSVSRKRKTSEFGSEPFLVREKPFHSKPFSIIKPWNSFPNHFQKRKLRNFVPNYFRKKKNSEFHSDHFRKRKHLKISSKPFLGTENRPGCLGCRPLGWQPDNPLASSLRLLAFAELCSTGPASPAWSSREPSDLSGLDPGDPLGLKQDVPWVPSRNP